MENVAYVHNGILLSHIGKWAHKIFSEIYRTVIIKICKLTQTQTIVLLFLSYAVINLCMCGMDLDHETRKMYQETWEHSLKAIVRRNKEGLNIYVTWRQKAIGHHEDEQWEWDSAWRRS